MKKSNKILLGGFLTVILLITGIHITLYAKYKNGHYTVYQPGDNEKAPAMQSFPGISVITIRNGTAVISFGDVLSVEKGKEKSIQYIQQGDSLVISPRNEEERFMNRSPVKLILPLNVTISAYNSNISFEKGKENPGANPTIFLYNSNSTFAFSGKAIQLGHVKVNASDNSTAALHGNSQLGHLEVELKNSSLEDDGGDIGQLSIATDSASQLRLQSKHLLKAKITSIPNNP